MSIRRVKDRTGLVAEARVMSRSFRPHYFTAYLWRDRAAMLRNTKGMGPDTRACHCPTGYYADGDGKLIYLLRKMGEVHFVMGDWDEEVVAHEVQHAVFNMVRCLAQTPIADLYTQTKERMAEEELFCYDAGRWVRDLYHWLWEHDPSERWKRVEAPEVRPA